MNGRQQGYYARLFGLVLLLAGVLSGCGGGDKGRDPILGLPAATLVSLAVTPAVATIPIASIQQFVAIASFSDGSAKDVTNVAAWTSSTPAVATVNASTGVATAITSGTAQINASFDGKAGAAGLTVSAATMVSLAIAPLTPSVNIAATQRFTAIGNFSDGSSRDLTGQATFSSGNLANASVSAAGLATGIKAGTSLINAHVGLLDAATQLTVRPATLVSIRLLPVNPQLLIGASQQLTVTGTYSDGSTLNVTPNAVLVSAAPAMVKLGLPNGLASAITAGASLVTANFGGMTDSTTVTVAPATLTSIVVTPANAAIMTGATQAFLATGSFSDGSLADLSSTVAWTSGSSAVATILTGGVATGVGAGTSTITASSAGKSGTAQLSVTAPLTLTGIVVTPIAASIETSAQKQFLATGTYSDNSTANISNSVAWTSNNITVGTVLAGGMMTGLSPGNALVTASLSGKTGTASLTVIAPLTLLSITVLPANPNVLIGATPQFQAQATYSDNSTADISASASWGSATASVATIASNGKALALAVGTSSVSASLGGKSGSTTLTVSSVVPVVSTINLNTAARFAILAGNALTNNSGGTTLISGDVGSPSQTVDPVQTAGYANFKSGAILTNALADLQTAISDGNSRTCTVTQAGGVDLGGLVFTPGVCCYGGAINITGIFTLNGPGFYLFRSSGTLDTAANASVALTGGATADNVFWIPGAAVTLGANGAFKGTILEQSAAITVGDNTTLLNGRVLSASAVTLLNNQIAK